MVAGSVEPTRPATPRRKWIEVPKSPCSTCASQIRYCRNSGRSRPISRRLASISASVAFGGSDIAAGSTGRRRRMQNSSAETISRMTTETRMRRAMSGRMEVMGRLPERDPLLSRLDRSASTRASRGISSHRARGRRPHQGAARLPPSPALRGAERELPSSRPLHRVAQDPAIGVFRVGQVLLAHHREHALQQRDRGAGLDRGLVERAIARRCASCSRRR